MSKLHGSRTLQRWTTDMTKDGRLLMNGIGTGEELKKEKEQKNEMHRLIDQGEVQSA